MNDTLNGRAVKIRNNDFIEIDLAAHIVLVDFTNRKLLLKLDVPLNVSGIIYDYAVATPRLAKDSLTDLLSNRMLGSTITWVPVSKFDASQALDISWWRGGAAAITDIYLE